VSEGVSFGAYRVVRKVGQGGMGAVFLGEHSLIGRRAAIKVLHRDRSSQRESIDRFFTEARASAKLEDPGIVQIYDFGITPAGVAYLVMEYLDGESLSARLRRLRVLHPHDAVRITRQIAGSLAAAHTNGIVHRDLKPENLMMVRDKEATAGERPKILDFGIAKLGDDNSGSSHRTRTGAVMGTPAYMSPEQCNDTGKIDHRTDIYSLGCVLFHLLTGRPPFNAIGVGEMIAAHLKEAPPRASSLVPHIPGVIDPLVARCLAKRPEDRFATMLELSQACDAVLEQLPAELPTMMEFPQVDAREDATTTLGTSAGESTAKTRPRRIGMWIAVSAAAVAAGVVLAVMTTSSSSEKSTPAPAASPSPLAAPSEPIAKPEPPPAKPEPPPSETLPKLAPPPSEPPPIAPPPVSEAKPVEAKPPSIKKPAPKPPKNPAGSVYDWD
jgi:serine/threonine protein kinase